MDSTERKTISPDPTDSSDPTGTPPTQWTPVNQGTHLTLSLWTPLNQGLFRRKGLIVWHGGLMGLELRRSQVFEPNGPNFGLRQSIWSITLTKFKLVFDNLTVKGSMPQNHAFNPCSLRFTDLTQQLFYSLQLRLAEPVLSVIQSFIQRKNFKLSYNCMQNKNYFFFRGVQFSEIVQKGVKDFEKVRNKPACARKSRSNLNS